jgi:hypothetical protein
VASSHLLLPFVKLVDTDVKEFNEQDEEDDDADPDDDTVAHRDLLLQDWVLQTFVWNKIGVDFKKRFGACFSNKQVSRRH